MHRGLWGIAAVALSASACTTPHHSNALIFGTNTNFGIDVGQNATGTPSILIGYRRQEAVFMPLVASVAFDENGVPTPCAVYPQVLGPRENIRLITADGEPSNLPPCFLVGQNGGAVDSYSVLASFGAQFSASGTNPQASGGLAQFFATGLAAQALAIRGGPALVATGPAAAQTGASDNSDGIAALYNAPTVTARATALRTAGATARQSVLDYLTAHTTDANFAEELGLLEAAASQGGAISYMLCDGLQRTACLTEVGSDFGLRTITLHQEKWDAAIRQRKQARGIQ